MARVGAQLRSGRHNGGGSDYRVVKVVQSVVFSALMLDAEDVVVDGEEGVDGVSCSPLYVKTRPKPKGRGGGCVKQGWVQEGGDP
jgi:hypothetical protein